MKQADTTVLLVDDEDAIRLTLRDYLERKEYTVLVASDGVGAIKHILDSKIDIIITDYRMDIFGGDYWIRFLERFCPDHKVIVTSGFLRPDFQIPFPVMYKPFDYAELEGAIRDSLDVR